MARVRRSIKPVTGLLAVVLAGWLAARAFHHAGGPWQEARTVAPDLSEVSSAVDRLAPPPAPPARAATGADDWDERPEDATPGRSARAGRRATVARHATARPVPAAEPPLADRLFRPAKLETGTSYEQIAGVLRDAVDLAVGRADGSWVLRADGNWLRFTGSIFVPVRSEDLPDDLRSRGRAGGTVRR